MPENTNKFDQVANSIEQNFAQTVAKLSDLVRIPSVSWDGFDQSQVQLSAEKVAALLQETGVFEQVQVAQATDPVGGLGRPAVLATRKAKNGKPTILLYAHHDVQPQGNAENWRTPPFEPTLIGERLYGRGASDDKAGIMVHIAALTALAESYADFDLGVSVFFEGEEEFGSRSFANFIEKYQAALAADVIVVADSDNVSTDTPSLTVGLRGNVAFKLKISTLGHASHSGMYGGAVPDAPLAMIRLLNSFWNEDGSVAVAGLITHQADEPDFSSAQLREDAQILPGVTEIGTGKILSKLWNQPAITITGIDIPTVQNASNTLVPSVTVKVSARIAPGQDAAEAFDALQKHLVEHNSFGANLEISDIDLGNPFLVDTSGAYAKLAKEAMKLGWDAEPVEVGVGGSIPFIADLVRVFPNAQILVTGVEDPGSLAHSPNESQHLGVLRKAIRAEAFLLARLNDGELG